MSAAGLVSSPRPGLVVFDHSFIMRSGAFYRNVVKIARNITINQSKSTFGFDDSCVSLL